MNTKKKIRPSRTAQSNPSRYKVSQGTVHVSEETTEQNWIVFALAVFLLLGVGFISAISYILMLG